MTRLDAIEKYGVDTPCDFCFFGVVVVGLCTTCDGRDKIDKKLRELNENSARKRHA